MSVYRTIGPLVFGDVTMLAIICTFHFNQTLSQCDYLRKPKYHWKRAAYCVIHAVHQLLSFSVHVLVSSFPFHFGGRIS